MVSRKNIVIVAGVALISATAWAAPVRIDFADDGAASTPGFTVQPTDQMSTISDHLVIGSNVPNAPNGVDFLRISSSTSSVQGSDVLGFIVTMPPMHLTARSGSDSDGVGVDMYDVTFMDGSLSSPYSPTGGGFAIYDRADTGLTTPLVTADLNLLDHTLFLFGGSGSLESSVGLNLTGVQALNGGNLITTLREFSLDAVMGAQFVVGISSASSSPSDSISERILTMANVDGSSSGSIASVVPEPATILLLGLGAVFAARRRTRG